MEFGRRSNFADFDKTEAEIKSNPALMSNYVRMDPVTHSTQCSKVFAVHEVSFEMWMFEGGDCREMNTCVCTFVLAGEHNHRDLQGQQDVSLRRRLAEGYKHEGLGADGQVQAQDREGRVVHPHDAPAVACKKSFPPMFSKLSLSWKSVLCARLFSSRWSTASCRTTRATSTSSTSPMWRPSR